MERIRELSALRGIAAFVVVTLHMLIVFPLFTTDTSQTNAPWLNMLKYTPLHIMWDGSGAVRLFFILSGFVLSLPFWREQTPTYLHFLVKRVCRLYLPYVIALLVGASLDMLLAGHYTLPHVGDIINLQWQHQVTTSILLTHLILIDSFYHPEINDVFWTLVHEMRVSLIFPLLMALARRQTARQFLMLCFLMSLVGYFGTIYVTRGIWQNTDYFQSLSFVWFFALGIALAQHRERLIRWHRGLAATTQAWLCVLALCSFSYQWLWPDNHILHGNLRDDIFTGLGACWFIIAAQAVPRMQTWLRHPVPQWLGDISFSLYLYHMPLIIGAVWLLHAVLPIWCIVLIAGVTSIGVAVVMHRLVEMPAQQLGRRFVASMRRAKASIALSEHTLL